MSGRESRTSNFTGLKKLRICKASTNSLLGTILCEGILFFFLKFVHPNYFRPHRLLSIYLLYLVLNTLFFFRFYNSAFS